ncbi:MAG: hypothetical protein IJH63_06180 [Methanobrevibacter sp.]|nr:hypothetical protein [Methanobrevibacter sp.]
MKIEDILNMGLKKFNQLTEKELSKTLNYMNKVANDRVRRLLKNNLLNIPAFKKIKNVFGIEDEKKNIKMKEVSFTIPRGATLNEKRNLFMRVKSFLQAKTSTVTGSQQWKKEQDNRFYDFLHKDKNDNIDEKNIEYDEDKMQIYYDVMARIEELHPSMTLEVKYEVERYAGQLIFDKKIYDIDTIIDELNKLIDNLMNRYESDYVKKHSDPFYSV